MATERTVRRLRERATQFAEARAAKAEADLWREKKNRIKILQGLVAIEERIEEVWKPLELLRDWWDERNRGRVRRRRITEKEVALCGAFNNAKWALCALRREQVLVRKTLTMAKKREIEAACHLP